MNWTIILSQTKEFSSLFLFCSRFKNLAYSCHTITTGNLPIASQVHVPTIPFRRRHFRIFLQAEKKGQYRLAESLCQLRRTELDRHQHPAAVMLEFLAKSHPDKQRRGRMAQRAQQTGAGRLTICLSLRYGVAFRPRAYVARLATANSSLALIRRTRWPPECISGVDFSVR